MKVLVTGAKGQLGSTFIRVLRDSNEVVGTVRDELDLTDDISVRAVISEVRPDLILNCAAYNEVDSAESCPETALAVNAFGVQALAVMAAEFSSTLVHFSTDFVFDGNTSKPYSEADTPNPQSVYATSKLLGEWFAAETPQHYVIRVESLLAVKVCEEVVSIYWLMLYLKKNRFVRSPTALYRRATLKTLSKQR